MPTYPGTGQSPWGVQLKQYIDDGDARSEAAQTAAEQAVIDAEAARDQAASSSSTAQSAATTAAASSTSAAASAVTAAQAAEDASEIAGLTGEDEAVAFLINDGNSDTATALSASIVDETGIRDTPSGGSKGFSPNPSNQIGPTADAYTVTGGSTNFPNRIGNASLSDVSGYDNAVWRSCIAAVIQGFHCVVVGSDGHPTVSGGSYHFVRGGYGAIGGGLRNGVFAAYSAVNGGRLNSAGANAATTLNGAVTAGATSIVVTDATGIAVGQEVFIDNGANLDSAVVASIAGTTINLTGPYQHISTTDAAGEPTGTGLGANHASGTVVFFADGTRLQATVLGGYLCHAFGIGSGVGGNNSQAHGTYSLAWGNNVKARGTASTALGDSTETTASASNALAIGISTVATSSGEFATSAGATASTATQAGVIPFRNNTTSATVANIATLAVPDNTTTGYSAVVTAREPATGDSKVWTVAGGVKRTSGTTAHVGSAPTPVVAAADAGAAAWTLGTLIGTGTFNLRGTGEAAKTIVWSVELTYSRVGTSA